MVYETSQQKLDSTIPYNVNPGLINPYSDYVPGGTPKSDFHPL